MSGAWKLVLCLAPLALNRRPQEGQGMWSHRREDHMTDTGKFLVGVVGEAERRPTDQERMRGLTKIN